MTTVFDASTVTFDQYAMLALPGIALLVALYARMCGKGRTWTGIWTGIAILLFLLVFAIPMLDHHVRAALTDGSARTVEGVISQHKRETTRRWSGRSTGVGITSTNRYTTTTSEQFFVGSQWFWLRVNGYPSNAAFSNGEDPPLPLHDGTRVRISWFADAWNGDETRILKLEIDQASARAAAARGRANPAEATVDAGPAPAPAARVASSPALPADFAAFWARFSAAAASGDPTGVKALTRFPFLFAGTPLDADRFDSIWAGLFPAPLRPCFGTARPLPDGDAWSVSCGVYVYVFERDATGWRFAGFTADPEAGDQDIVPRAGPGARQKRCGTTGRTPGPTCRHAGPGHDQKLSGQTRCTLGSAPILSTSDCGTVSSTESSRIASPPASRRPRWKVPMLILASPRMLPTPPMKPGASTLAM
jgi:hypothetical protein